MRRTAAVAASTAVLLLTLLTGCGSGSTPITSLSTSKAAAAPAATTEAAKLSVRQAAAVYTAAFAPVSRATTAVNAALAPASLDMPTVRAAGHQLETAYRAFSDVLGQTKWPAAVQPDITQLSLQVAKMISWASTIAVMLGPPMPPQPTDDGSWGSVRSKLGISG